MATESSSLSGPWPAQRGRKILLLLGLTVGMLLVLYFGLTSQPFLQRVVLPRVGAACHAQISAANIALSPFAKLRLRQVRLTTTGDTPLLEADEILVRYRLFAVWAGRFAFPEIAIKNAKVRVVEAADGTSNLDALRHKGPPRPGVPMTPQIELGQVRLEQCALYFTRHTTDGSTHHSELRGLDLALDQLQNGAPGKLTLSVAWAQTNHVQTVTPAATAQIAGTLSANLEFDLRDDLKPRTLKGDVKFGVGEAGGDYADLMGIKGTFRSDPAPNKVWEMTLRIEQGNRRLGQARLFGPVDLDRSEARVRFELEPLDPRVLKLAGAPFGLDFGNTALSGTNLVDVSQRGDAISANGRINALQFSVRHPEGATPPLDLHLDYQVNLNRQEQAAIVHRFSLLGRQAERDLLSLSQDRAMNLAWGRNIHGLNPAVVSLTLNDLDLTQWRWVLGTNAPAGLLNLQARATCKRDGQEFDADVSASLRDLGLSIGPVHLTQALCDFRGHLIFSDYRRIHLDNFALSLAEQGTPLFTANGGAGYDLVSRDCSVQTSLEAELPKLLERFPSPGLTASSGQLSLGALWNLERGSHRASLNLSLSRFNGRVGEVALADTHFRIEGDGEARASKLNCRRLSVEARRGTTSAGVVETTGQYDLDKRVGEFTLNVVNLNEQVLEPALGPTLAPRRLASLALNGSGSVRLNSATETTLDAELELAQLAVHNPGAPRPTDPIDLRAQLGVTQRTNKLDLHKLLLALPPTPRATNQVILHGQLDLASTHPKPSSLTITADALDFTPLYDALSAGAASPNQAVATPDPLTPTQTPPPAAAPRPRRWPVQDLTAEIKVAQAFLRELAATNWQATLRVTNQLTSLRPCQFTLNGAPVQAALTLDLAQPGQSYDIFLRAVQVPFAPLAQSFAAERASQAAGDVYLDLQLQGLRRVEHGQPNPLAGHLDLSLTNLTLGTIGPGTQRLLGPVVATLGLSELNDAPLTLVNLNAVATSGHLELRQFLATSDAIYARSRGMVPLASAWTQSRLNLPVQLAISQLLATKLKLASSAPSPRPGYLSLPDCVTLTGTLAQPQSQVDPAKLLGVVVGLGAGTLNPQPGQSVPGAAHPPGSPVLPSPATATSDGTNLLSHPSLGPGTNAPLRLVPGELLRGPAPPR